MAFTTNGRLQWHSLTWQGMGGLTLLAAIIGSAIAFADYSALFICIALLACVFILIDFRVGVVLLTIVIPISASALFPHSIAGITGLNPMNLLLIGTLVAWFLQQPRSERLAQLTPTPLRWCYVAPMVIAALLGLSHVGEIPSAFLATGALGFDSAGGYLRDMLFKPLFLVLFAVLVAAAVVRSPDREYFLLPMLVAVWLMALMTIVFVYLSGASLAELASIRFRGFFSPLGMHANDLGRFYAIAYALMLFTFAASNDAPMRMVLLLSMGMVVIALMLTFSRGAFLGFFMVNLWFLLSRRKVMALLLSGAVLASLLFLLPGAVYERLGSGWDAGLNAISAGRLEEIWLPLLPELWNSPVYGQGLGATLWSEAMRSGRILQVIHPHNAYLQAALDMGLAGLIVICAYFIHVWKGFRRLHRDPTLSPSQRGFHEGAAVGLASFLLAGFAGSSLMPVPEQFFLWFAIGIMYGEMARKAKAPSTKPH